MKRLHWRLVFLVCFCLPAFAGAITYDCDAGLSSTDCTALTTTIANTYSALVTNATATIYVQQSNIGDVAENTQVYSTVNYSKYLTDLTGSESGAGDVTAVNSLVNSLNGCSSTCANPVNGAITITLPGPLESALNVYGTNLGNPEGICFLVTNGQATGGCFNDINNSTYGECSLGSASCYNDILTVGDNVTISPGANQYDFITAVEHETDEALGTPSCIPNTPKGVNPSTQIGNCGVSAADLFRYSGYLTRSYLGTNGNQAMGSTAYFSIDSGLTNIAAYNNTNNDDDYGDFSATCTYVQDATGCSGQSGLTIANDGGVELALLDAVGYNLTAAGQQLDAVTSDVAAPEPSTVFISFAGLGAIGMLARRRLQS